MDWPGDFTFRIFWIFWTHSFSKINNWILGSYLFRPLNWSSINCNGLKNTSVSFIWYTSCHWHHESHTVWPVRLQDHISSCRPPPPPPPNFFNIDMILLHWSLSTNQETSHVLYLIYTRIPHTDQSCDLNLPPCKYFHVSIFTCSVAVFFKHEAQGILSELHNWFRFKIL